MDLALHSNPKETVSVNDSVFDVPYNESLVHQALVAFQANARQGTKNMKNRSAVSGGGAKPWRQKGTGRARAGTIRSPLWRGGGATFGNQQPSYTQKINKKMYRGAMRSILSNLAREGRLKVVEDLNPETPKTKAMVQHLKAMELNHVLIVSDTLNPNLILATRNIPNVALCTPSELDPVSLIHYKNTLMTKSAIKKLEERYQ